MVWPVLCYGCPVSAWLTDRAATHACYIYCNKAKESVASQKREARAREHVNFVHPPMVTSELFSLNFGHLKNLQ